MSAQRCTVVWGLKRSGIHLVVNWLFANLGGRIKGELEASTLHPQLRDGFADDARGVAFFNNCGGLHSRSFSLGDLTAADLNAAVASHQSTILGMEDCSLNLAALPRAIPGSASLLVLRDPLNNLASRMKAAETRPEVFRFDVGYIDLYESYCAEALGRTSHLPAKVVVSFNRFVQDRSHRDEVASALGLVNVDDLTEVAGYGGGSSFSRDRLSSTEDLMTRFLQHPLPAVIVDELLARHDIREACSRLFGYDLEAVVAAR
ncbi:MAG: hypothetical protein ACOYXM_09220 [Actinomycetota bacterium]